MEVIVHLENIYLKIDYFAYLSFCSNNKQKPDEGVFQLSLMPLKEKFPDGWEAWKKVVNDTFNKVAWKNEQATVTIKVTPPLRDPEGLLKSLGHELSMRLENADMEAYICSCGHKASEHYYEQDYCEHPGCDCPQLGEPLENWDPGTITNVGDGPGGFKIAE